MSLLQEYGAFLRHNKRYWLLPLLLIIAAAVALIFVGDTGDVAPLMYAGDSGS